jgi:hypothetical protein
MSELRRWTEEGASPAESSLLEASRAERAPDEARARALRVLGVAGVVTATSATATTATASVAGLATWTKLVGLAVIVGGATVGGVYAARERQAAPAAASRAVLAPSAVSSAPPRDMAPADDSAAAAPPAPPADTQAPRAARPSSGAVRSARPTPSDERLSEEVAALERAHQALAAHQADAAIRELDRYAASFPHGALASEAVVLRVQALVERGDRAAAKKLADAYSSGHPESPFARRLQVLVGEP